MFKTKIAIGLIIAAAAIAGAIVYYKSSLPSNQNNGQVVSSPQTVTLNAFQDFYDFFPDAGGFQNCVKSGLGKDFDAAYYKGIMPASAGNPNNNPVVDNCIAATMSSPAKAFSEFPPSLQQCLKDALGSDFDKAMQAAENKPKFQPTSEEQQKINNCPTLQEFKAKADALYKYIKQQYAENAAKPTSSTAPAYFEVRESDGKGGFISTGLDSRYLISATVNSDSTNGRPSVAINLDKQGDQLLGEITARNVGKQVAVFIDGKLITAPTVQGKITGPLQLGNSLTADEATNLAKGLNAGRGLTQMPK